MQNKPATRIFLDSGDPEDTKEVLNFLGFLDGQTTNPSLVAKNPLLQARLQEGHFSEQQLLEEYKKIVSTVRALLPDGSVSIEVYADETTSTETMITQAREMNGWIDNPHIKLPINRNGLEAASQLVKEGIKINMTLCFSQEQAAAVYAATRGAKKGDVFVSPFIGRFDDIGIDGVDLIENIVRMYSKGDGHVELLAASIRSVEHLQYVVSLGADILTAPVAILKDWADQSKPALDQAPEDHKEYLKTIEKTDIHYEEVDLDREFYEYNLDHELTTKGLAKFAADWNNLLGK